MRAVFLDRDGVINENRGDHVKCWAEFRFLPGAPEAIARLSEAGISVFVITNQAIVNRGLVSHEVVEGINRRMVTELARRGAMITAVAFCPHRPDEQCGCRKPQPGLLFGLAREYGVSLDEAIFIGDALSDLEAGRAAGCDTMLVLTGRGRTQLSLVRSELAGSITIANDLSDAIDLLLQRSEHRPQ